MRLIGEAVRRGQRAPRRLAAIERGHRALHRDAGEQFRADSDRAANARSSVRSVTPSSPATVAIATGPSASRRTARRTRASLASTRGPIRDWSVRSTAPIRAAVVVASTTRSSSSRPREPDVVESDRAIAKRERLDAEQRRGAPGDEPDPEHRDAEPRWRDERAGHRADHAATARQLEHRYSCSRRAARGVPRRRRSSSSSSRRRDREARRSGRVRRSARPPIIAARSRRAASWSRAPGSSAPRTTGGSTDRATATDEEHRVQHDVTVTRLGVSSTARGREERVNRG